MVSLAVVDDHEALRKNITGRLTGLFSVVLEGSAPETLFRYLRTHDAAYHPQVVLMDNEMDEMDGIEATRQLKNL
jgi:CheY-like chemotaxis protein